MSEAEQTIQETPEEIKRRKNTEKMRRWREKNPDASKAIARRSYHKHAEKNRARDRARWEKRKDQVAARKKSHYAIHGEAHRAKERARYYRHQEKKKAWQREYNKRSVEKRRVYCVLNRERLYEVHREWIKKHPEKNKHYRGSRRARELNCETPATSKDVEDFLGPKTHCHYCKRPFGPKQKKTLDHVIPLKKNGAHSVENFAAACFPCNRRKNTKTVEEFAKLMGALFF